MAGVEWSSEIEQVEEPRSTSRLPEIVEEDYVYVAVGKGMTSSDALSWAIRSLVQPGTTICLVHVFPEVRNIPTPLGMLPKNQVNESQIESHMNQTREKMKELLRPFINMCHSSAVNVDTILIERDDIVGAVLDLIPVLQIQKLVVGATKSSLRSRRGSVGKALQIQNGAMEYCAVKVICDGKEVQAIDRLPSSPQTPQASSTPENAININDQHDDSMNEQHNDLPTCCFLKRF